MIPMETFEEIVRAIYNSGDENAKMLANEASLYYDTAIVCAAKGIDLAMDYYKNQKSSNLYLMYLHNDPTEK